MTLQRLHFFSAHSALQPCPQIEIHSWAGQGVLLVKLGADAIELDVRLTSDDIPAVYHYFYLDMITTLPGPIFDYTFEQLQNAQSLDGQDFRIPIYFSRGLKLGWV